MGSKTSKPEPPKEFEEPWRKVDWNMKEDLISKLDRFQHNHPEIRQWRILLHGPIGAGKSCFINSTISSLNGKIQCKADEESNAGKSCTRRYKTYRVASENSVTLPFILNDIMGLESEEESGILLEDIISVLKGHVREGYTFNPISPLSESDPYFIKEPGPNDKVHCLVSVVPANSISQMELKNGIIQKMKAVRKVAIKEGIPHLVLMTKIDIICPLVKKDLRMVYKSKKIKEKMEECSQRVGPPMKCIFPVCNYHEEIDTSENKDVLILMALKAMVEFSKGYIQDGNI